MATLPGSDVVFRYSPTNSNFKTLVCESDSTFTQSHDITTEDTKCGLLKSIGNADNSIDVNAVTNTEPGATEGSWAAIMALSNAKTKVWVEYGDPNEEIFIKGQGWFSEVSTQNTSGETSKFSFTFTFDGDVDDTPES